MARQRTPKGIRMTGDMQRLLKLLAALEDRPEADVVEDALLGYLQLRSIGLTGRLDEARALANAKPEEVGDVVARLVDAMERALESDSAILSAGSGKERLREKRLAAAGS